SIGCQIGCQADVDRNPTLEIAAFLRESGEPRRNRTFNPQIKSLLLRQLSYRPTCAEDSAEANPDCTTTAGVGRKRRRSHIDVTLPDRRRNRSTQRNFPAGPAVSGIVT